MKNWIIADVLLLLTIVPCGAVMLRARRLTDLMVALQLAGTISVLALLVLAEAMQRPSFYDLALALALLSFPAALTFAHFVERWFR